MIRTRAVAILAALLAIALSACTTIGTGASELALQYEGGAFETNSYYSCVSDAGSRDAVDWGDDVYYYPLGQRDFSFGGKGDDKDAPAITSTTQDGQEISLSGTVKLTLTLSCAEFTDPAGKKWPGGSAQFFHEKIGNKDPHQPAYNTEGATGYGEGWSKMLQQYVGFALNNSLDNDTTRYTLDQLTLNSEKKNAWQANVKESLPATLKAMTFGVTIFQVETVLLEKPGVAKVVSDARAQKIAAQEQVAASDVIASRAKTWPGGLEAYQRFLREQATNKAIESGKVPVLIVPEGSPVIASAGK